MPNYIQYTYDYLHILHFNFGLCEYWNLENYKVVQKIIFFHKKYSFEVKKKMK